LSLQVGKPWIIPEDDLIKNAGDWWERDAVATPCDMIVSAFVELRAIGSDAMSLLFNDGRSRSNDVVLPMEGILKILNSELDKWQQKWYTNFAQSKKLLTLYDAVVLAFRFF
jgi:hypothetical protein